MSLDGHGDAPAPASASDEEDEAGAECEMASVQHDYYSLRPTIISLWRHSHLPACSAADTSVIPETQVVLPDRKAVH